jgi:hypothetical protein
MIGINAAPLALGPIVGWKSGNIPLKWTNVEWTVTGAFSAVGAYEVMFVYTDGKSGLSVKNVKLYIGGVLVGIDEHEGLAFEPSENNIWTFQTKVAVGEKDSVVISADIQGHATTDSNGRLLVYSV